MGDVVPFDDLPNIFDAFGKTTITEKMPRSIEKAREIHNFTFILLFEMSMQFLDTYQNIFLRKQPKAWWIHLSIWVIFYALLVFYSIHKWEELFFPFAKATTACIFYAAAVYANYSWLLPKLFQSGNTKRYIFTSTIFLIIICLLRMGLEYAVLFPIHKVFYNFTAGQAALVCMTNLLAFGFGGLVFITTDYAKLLRKQEELKRRQTGAELALLKSQVQPHFLFNTLNNLYYLAYTHSEKTPQVIAKLSDIMRYFVDEAPKERVDLQTEINFLRNYIDLETMRMVHPMQIEFRENVPDEGVKIPPMLLIPMVENIFKHGVDKMQTANEASLELSVAQDQLSFAVTNRVHQPKAIQNKNGGLYNLRQRLKLLYDTDFKLDMHLKSDFFTVTLSIPISHQKSPEA